MKTLPLTRYGKTHPMSFVLSKYTENGNLYVGLMTNVEGYPEPWSNLTVNLSVKCDANCAYIDTNNNGNEIVDWLIDNELGMWTGRERVSGFCVYPEFMFFMDKLKEFCDADNVKEFEEVI